MLQRCYKLQKGDFSLKSKITYERMKNKSFVKIYRFENDMNSRDLALGYLCLKLMRSFHEQHYFAIIARTKQEAVDFLVTRTNTLTFIPTGFDDDMVSISGGRSKILLEDTVGLYQTFKGVKRYNRRDYHCILFLGVPIPRWAPYEVNENTILLEVAK